MNTAEKNKATQNLNTDQIIALMDVYLNEWMHRDELLWSQVFRFFYATLIVTVLPNIATFVGITLPEINSKIFPILGMLMALVFLYVGLGYGMRMGASSLTYEKMINMLGNEELERISIKDRSKMKWGYLFASPMSLVLVVTMFVALEAVALVMLLV
jgi:hypothetical protein